MEEILSAVVMSILGFVWVIIKFVFRSLFASAALEVFIKFLKFAKKMTGLLIIPPLIYVPIGIYLFISYGIVLLILYIPIVFIAHFAAFAILMYTKDAIKYRIARESKDIGRILRFYFDEEVLFFKTEAKDNASNIMYDQASFFQAKQQRRASLYMT